MWIFRICSNVGFKNNEQGLIRADISYSKLLKGAIKEKRAFSSLYVKRQHQKESLLHLFSQ